MIIIGLDGKNYSWNPSASQAETSNRSSLHEKAKALLGEIFPHDRVLEEVSLPGTKTDYRKSTLRGDLFLPNRMLLVEVHGEQHHNFNNFFFANKLQFYKARARDKDKKEWCSINSIKYVELNYNEDIDEWRRKI